MKNVSLFIARRYNTYTVLISMALILIASMLVGTFIYSGNLSLKIIRDLIFPNKILTGNQQILVIGLMLAYLIVQTTAIYLLFNKLLKSIPKHSKLGIAILIAATSLGTAGFLIFQKLNQAVWVNGLTLILISTGLLSILFGLLHFIFSKRKITGVNIITSIAVFAITIATCALFVILSVFSGLEKMNIQFFSNVNPDLKISPVKGKLLTDIDQITSKLDQNPQIISYAKVIEEKVSVEFEDKQDIAYIKGIDENY